MPEDISMPSAPSIRPERISAGNTVRYPIDGGAISQNHAISRKA